MGRNYVRNDNLGKIVLEIGFGVVEIARGPGHDGEVEIHVFRGKSDGGDRSWGHVGWNRMVCPVDVVSSREGS